MVEEDIPLAMLSRKVPHDVRKFCPNFYRMSDTDKRVFWAYFFQALAGAEAGLKSLRTVHLPEGLANDLWLWKQECPDASPDAFIFPNSRKRDGAKKNGFISTDNYRARVLKKLAEELGLRKLNFQVLRRTIATLAQTKGNVKDVQGILGHTKADTTVNVYMQPIEEGVKQTLDAIYAELTAGAKLVAVA